MEIKKINLVILVIISVVFMLPLAVTFAGSFMSQQEIIVNYSAERTVFDILEGIAEKFVKIKLIPNQATISQYADVLIFQPWFLVLLTNSLKLTVPIVIGNLFFSILTAYGFTIWKWKYKECVFFIYVLVMLMPLQAVLVPNYIIAEKLGIVDSYLAIILPGIFSPFGVFLIRQSMKTIPKEYFEAAQMDGANSIYLLTYIVIPQIRSGIAALAMLVFIDYWNMVEQAIIFIKDYNKEPLSIFLSRLHGQRLGVVFAASCVYMFLPFWFLLLGQDDLEKGIELSGIK